jgi:hypothetical protein
VPPSAWWVPRRKNHAADDKQGSLYHPEDLIEIPLVLTGKDRGVLAVGAPDRASSEKYGADRPSPPVYCRERDEPPEVQFDRITVPDYFIIVVI